MSCKTLFDSCGATQAELASALKLNQSTVSRILRGQVALKQGHIDAILAFFSKQLGRPVEYGEAFGAPKRRTRRAA